MIEVAGYCPMGCGPTLVLTGEEWSGEGNVTCSAEECPAAGRVHSVLQDPETEHIVVLEEEHFTVKHPLREHVESLFKCDIHQRLQELDGPPREPGRLLERGVLERPGKRYMLARRFRD